MHVPVRSMGLFLFVMLSVLDLPSAEENKEVTSHHERFLFQSITSCLLLLVISLHHYYYLMDMTKKITTLKLKCGILLYINDFSIDI